MKRLTAIVLALMLAAATLPFGVFAADESRAFEFGVQVNGRSDAKTVLGDVVTVSATLSEPGADGITMFAFRDRIIFNTQYFELVPDSIKGGGEGIYCSTEPLDASWQGWLAVSGSALATNFNGDTLSNPATLFTFQLKAIKSGTSVIIQRDHVMSTTMGLDEYPSSAGNNTVIIKAKQDFTDVYSADWYFDAVSYVSERSIMSGTGDGKFSPQSDVTRAQIITVLARLSGVDTGGGAEWHSKAVEWGVTQGITDGTNPDGAITRQDFAVMLYRYAGSPAVSGNLTAYPDNQAVSAWAKDALAWATGNKIISGSGGKLLPQDNTTRAQAAQIVYNYLNQ
jgi:hypothetical protein